MPKSRSESSSYALLGLLTICPMSGYELRQLIEVSIGYFWRESYGQIYPSLKRLATAGLVKRTTERQKGKPDKHMYGITDSGRDHLREWLKTTPQEEVHRNELLLKLFFGMQAGPEVAIAHVREMLAVERATLKAIEAIDAGMIEDHRQDPQSTYWRITANFGAHELAAHIRWAEETLETLEALAKKKASNGKQMLRPAFKPALRPAPQKVQRRTKIQLPPRVERKRAEHAS